MLSFSHPQGRFNFRVGGIALRNGEVLLQTTPDDSFWTIPGGRVEFCESSREALCREMQEELGETPSIGRLLSIAENFFEYGGQSVHEITLSFTMGFHLGSQVMTARQHWMVDENGSMLKFGWWPLARLDSISILPGFLTSLIRQPPSDTIHLVHRDET